MLQMGCHVRLVERLFATIASLTAHESAVRESSPGQRFAWMKESGAASGCLHGCMISPPAPKNHCGKIVAMVRCFRAGVVVHLTARAPSLRRSYGR